MAFSATVKVCECGKCGKHFEAERKRLYCWNPCNAPSQKVAKCKTCKQDFTTQGRGHGCYVFCSDKCKRIDGNLRKSERDAQTKKAKVIKRLDKIRPCRKCGSIFYHTHKDQKYCSNICATNAQKGKRNSSRQQRIACMCRFCGSIVLRTEYESHGKECFCDGECYLQFRKLFSTMVRASFSVKSDQSCEFCGKGIVGDLKAKRKFCSKRCVQSAAKQVRKMRKKVNGPIELISVDLLAEQHQWVCCGCKCVCTKSNGNSNPYDATIDHIIPVSKGGTHTWDNVQLMCRSCNNAKSDTLLNGAQLKLALTSNGCN